MQHIGNIINPSKLPRIGIVRLGRRIAGKIIEEGHFLFDVPDNELRQRIENIYGPTPKTLKVTFHTNDLRSAYTCEYQKWSSSRKTPYLMCSGNGSTAKEYGLQQSRSCPCNSLGTDCRKKTILRFLIPDISLEGTFLLVTKSEYSARMIQTTIEIAMRSGGLICGHLNCQGLKALLMLTI